MTNYVKMKPKELISMTERLIYQRLLKEYPGGLPSNVLKYRVPKCLRKYVPESINNLYNRDVLTKKGHRYSVINPL